MFFHLLAWPRDLGPSVYRPPIRVPELAEYLRTGEKLEFADPPVDANGRLLILNKAKERVSILGGTARNLRIAGESDWFPEFAVLVKAAGEAIDRSSSQFWPWFPYETINTNNPALRWFFALFDLAWARVPRSGLLPTVERTWQFPTGTKSESMGLPPASDVPDNDPESGESARPWLDRPWCYSEIADLSQASVLAINILLDALPASPGKGGQHADVARSKLKAPSKNAEMAYRYHVVKGHKQEKVAEILSDELKRPVDQGTVSRWISQCKFSITP
jgi:hypothetical protein